MSDTVVTAPDAKFSLDELLTRVEAGEEIVITREDVPVARLVPAAAPAPKPVRRPGLYAARASLDPEFFEPLPEEELRALEGGDE